MYEVDEGWWCDARIMQFLPRSIDYDDWGCREGWRSDNESENSVMMLQMKYGEDDDDLLKPVEESMRVQRGF